jgi:hypothetical protein
LDRRVTVKFWRMRPNPVEGVEFEASLGAVAALPLADTVTATDGSTYQLEMKPRVGDGAYFGDLIRLQSEALTSRLKKGTKAARLTLGVDEALGHHAAFVFHPHSCLLGMEVKMQAAGILKLADVVALLAHHQTCLGLPVLNKAAVNELAGKKNGTLTFRVADPAGLEAVDPELGSMRANLTFLKEMVDGAYVDITVGVGPRKAGLESGKLIRAVNWLLHEKDANRGHVQTIKVVQPGEDEAVLDFVKARFADTAVLNINGDPDQDWPVRKSFLETALNKALQHVHIED